MFIPKSVPIFISFSIIPSLFSIPNITVYLPFLYIALLIVFVKFPLSQKKRERKKEKKV